jgi:hypothetical protein
MAQRLLSPERPVRLARWLVCGAACATASVTMAQTVPGGIYTCVDASGRKLTADRPIPECSDREQRVLNPSGTLKTTIGPQLSDKERMANEARRRAEEAERLRQEEVRRRDLALLARYPNQASHEQGRAQAQAQALESKRSANSRLEELKLEQKRIGEELEFYTSNPSQTPAALLQRQKASNEAITMQRKLMAEQDRQLQRINANFDEELSRLKPLWEQAAQARQR